MYFIFSGLSQEYIHQANCCKLGIFFLISGQLLNKETLMCFFNFIQDFSANKDLNVC